MKILFSTRYVARHILSRSTTIVLIFSQDTVNREGLFLNDLFEEIINDMWFRAKDSEGITYAYYFDPPAGETSPPIQDGSTTQAPQPAMICNVTIALVATSVCIHCFWCYDMNLPGFSRSRVCWTSG